VEFDQPGFDAAIFDGGSVLIGNQPGELLRVGVGAGRARKVGESAGEGGGGLQIERRVGPGQKNKGTNSGLAADEVFRFY
jgi:hypothetical protein